MSKRLDDLYAVSMADGTVLCGKCGEKRWPDGVPEDDASTPVYYRDTWRDEVAGPCEDCGLFVDPEKT